MAAVRVMETILKKKKNVKEIVKSPLVAMINVSMSLLQGHVEQLLQDITITLKQNNVRILFMVDVAVTLTILRR
jgi:hypothetical protein